MKNAYVTSHHYGDDGNTPEGKILRGISSTRFDELERAGLVREATPDELKRGGDLPFRSEAQEAEEAAASEKAANPPQNKAAPKPANKAA